MADFAKRPEVTVSTMGKVHNPTGEGVRAISSQAQAKAAKVATAAAAAATTIDTTETKNGSNHNSDGSATAAAKQHAGASSSSLADSHETKVKEGTAKRNITRKKTADKDSGNYNSTHKKQGGHGKGQWKDDIDPSLYVDADIPIDEKDPIYDEAEDSTKYILTSGGGSAVVVPANGTAASSKSKRGYDPGTEKAVYGPLLTLSEFKIQFAECLQEYFDSCDSDEVIRSLQELGCQEYHSEIVKKAISLALDKGPRERELTSRLLTCLHPTPLSMTEMEAGFNALLDAMEELSTDVPEAKTMCASFLARAVVDEVLPPAFLSEQNNERPGDAVVEKAVALLNREHCTARLEKVWGPGDGRPVSELKVDMDQLLQEYLLSRELDEAARCVKELEAPHFHHELVKRGVFAAMELDGKRAAELLVLESSNNNNSNSNKKEVGAASDVVGVAVSEAAADALANIDAMAALFGFLVRNAIVSEYQVKKGVSRLHDILSDLTLDVPTAPHLLAAFETMAHEQGCLPAAAAAPVVPAREAAAPAVAAPKPNVGAVPADSLDVVIETATDGDTGAAAAPATTNTSQDE